VTVVITRVIIKDLAEAVTGNMIIKKKGVIIIIFTWNVVNVDVLGLVK
tara:strand:+ start:276 stop:419 length:144 start_codon:yes stop_codon:yes gene_type:complete